MSGVDDIRATLQSAKVLAFRPPTATTEGAASSQMGEKADSAAADERGQRDGDDRNGGRDRDQDPDLAFAFVPMTDLGNAERFAGRFRDLLRYCPAIGWLAWDGRRWSRESAAETVKRAEHLTARAIQEEAAAVLNTPGADFVVVEETRTKPPVFFSDKLKAWGRASEGAQKLAAMSKRACAMLAISIESLDHDPMKICVLNGTLHISRDHDGGYVRLIPHNPSDYITRLAPVTYDPEAEAPLYDRFLDEIQPADVTEHGVTIMPERRTMQTFLHEWFGYCLTGDMSEQKMMLLYGKGRNGKGVLINIVTYIAGDYADSIPIESFIDAGRARAGGQATPDLAGLPGIRVLSTSEPKKGAKLDEAFVKLFTGGDRIKARHLNHDYFGFVPQAKLTMQSNYKPGVPGTDEGIWSRIMLVPCLVFIPPERRDPKLGDKLKAEASGILNRLLDGLRRWLDAGELRQPESVREATAKYRADSDPLGQFLETCTAQSEGGRVQATYLYELFCAWAKANGETAWTAKGFGSAMKDRGIATKKSDVQFYIGIRMTRSVADFMDSNLARDDDDQGRGPSDYDDST